MITLNSQSTDGVLDQQQERLSDLSTKLEQLNNLKELLEANRESLALILEANQQISRLEQDIQILSNQLKQDEELLSVLSLFELDQESKDLINSLLSPNNTNTNLSQTDGREEDENKVNTDETDKAKQDENEAKDEDEHRDWDEDEEEQDWVKAAISDTAELVAADAMDSIIMEELIELPAEEDNEDSTGDNENDTQDSINDNNEEVVTEDFQDSNQGQDPDDIVLTREEATKRFFEKEWFEFSPKWDKLDLQIQMVGDSSDVKGYFTNDGSNKVYPLEVEKIEGEEGEEARERFRLM